MDSYSTNTVGDNGLWHLSGLLREGAKESLFSALVFLSAGLDQASLMTQGVLGGASGNGLPDLSGQGTGHLRARSGGSMNAGFGARGEGGAMEPVREPVGALQLEAGLCLAELGSLASPSSLPFVPQWQRIDRLPASGLPDYAFAVVPTSGAESKSGAGKKDKAASKRDQEDYDCFQRIRIRAMEMVAEALIDPEPQVVALSLSHTHTLMPSLSLSLS